MKKIVCIALCAVSILCACSSDSKPSRAQYKKALMKSLAYDASTYTIDEREAFADCVVKHTYDLLPAKAIQIQVDVKTEQENRDAATKIEKVISKKTAEEFEKRDLECARDSGFDF